MKPLLTPVLAALALGLAAAPALAGKFNKKLSIGDAAPTWEQLEGTDGKKHSFADWKDKDALVVVFTCNSCIVAAGYEERLVAFAAECNKPGSKVGFVAINVNKIPEDSLENMKTRAAEKKLPYAYLFDASQQIAKDYGAGTTPEVILLDRDRKVVYMGAFDDSSDAQKVAAKYLDAAVDAVLAGQKPETAETSPHGCRIRWENARRRNRKT